MSSKKMELAQTRTHPSVFPYFPHSLGGGDVPQAALNALFLRRRRRSFSATTAATLGNVGEAVALVRHDEEQPTTLGSVGEAARRGQATGRQRRRRRTTWVWVVLGQVYLVGMILEPCFDDLWVWFCGDLIC